MSHRKERLDSWSPLKVRAGVKWKSSSVWKWSLGVSLSINFTRELNRWRSPVAVSLCVRGWERHWGNQRERDELFTHQLRRAHLFVNWIISNTWVQSHVHPPPLLPFHTLIIWWLAAGLVQTDFVSYSLLLYVTYFTRQSLYFMDWLFWLLFM